MAAVKSRFVIVLGTSKGTMGGIAAVIRSYEHAGLSRRWPTIHIATHGDGTGLHKFRLALRAFLKFASLVTSRQVLLVHVHAASNASFWRKSAFILLAFVARRPVIFHLHGGGFIDFYNRRWGAVRRWFIRSVLNRVAEIVVLTEEWHQRISRITTNNNISVIVNPVESKPMGRIRRKDNIVLFLGRLDKDKGMFELVDAIPLVLREFPDVKIWFAGEGDRRALQLHVERNGVSGAVEFLGWINEDAKRKVLGEATLYVLPSRIEGLPMAVLEAMAVGLPVVATNVGGIPNVVEDGVNGFLVRPLDIKGLAAAISRLLKDAPLRTKMGTASREKINEHFVPERVMPRIDALYTKLADM